jgi:antitoxin HicB
MKRDEHLMSQRTFKILLQWDPEEKVFQVTVPALSGCVTYRKTREEAIARAQEAIIGYIEALELSHLPLPERAMATKAYKMPGLSRKQACR